MEGGSSNLSVISIIEINTSVESTEIEAHAKIEIETLKIRIVPQLKYIESAIYHLTLANVTEQYADFFYYLPSY
jgi:hypothetical protein